MSWEDYKEAMKDEMLFYRRNPEFPVVFLLLILFMALVAFGVIQ